MKYYAHSSENKEHPWQLISEHLLNTAKIAQKNASKFNSDQFGYICGLLHDLGKYSNEFQQKLLGTSVAVDHSTAGAKEALGIYGERFGRLIAYCIAGHHSGLPDYGTAASFEGTLSARVKKEVKDYSAYKDDENLNIKTTIPNITIKPNPDNIGFTLAFFVRMLYSCLVDADFIDTETYISDALKPRGSYPDIFQLCCRLNSFLTNLPKGTSKINIKRNEILQRCLHMSKYKTGLFTLTVPTGGGKTYSSLAFALNHALVNNLERIIYVIPYTSIIEQNARVFKGILGEDNVLEHHSNYQFNKENTEYIQSLNEKLKLATENWDIPIVVTTNVQFFESLFSNRSSKCRKIHNISKSVIIFDEAQMLPVEYLKPCLLAVSELVQNYNSTAILCTATQPSVNKFLPKNVKPLEIIECPEQLYEDFKKVKVDKRDEMDDEMLSDELNQLDQVLCIVSTRKHAKEIYDRLDGDSFHLSTLMCPLHRQQTLVEIRERLKNGQPCRVVSTQLIEAGVDVDFPVVYRSIAGIDSIVQSAGRCNREGKLKEGKVIVFKPLSEYAKVKGYLERTAKVSEMVFRKYEDPISLEAIDYYFEMLYDIEGEGSLDKKGIIECFEENYKQFEFSFQSASEKFRLIESNTYSIVIPYNEEAIKLINEAKFNHFPLSLARKLQPYTISIYEYEYKTLLKNSILKMVNDSFIVLDVYEKHYSNKTGLIIPVDTYGEAIFV